MLLPENVTGERTGRLESICGRIATRIYYLAVNDGFDVAAITGSYIAIGHAFNDGNKRTAFACIDIILAAANATLEYVQPCEDDPLFAMIIDCAQGKVDDTQLANYLRKVHMRSTSDTSE